MSHKTATQPASTSLDPAVKRVIAVVFLGPFMTQMDSTVVNVSLSNIRDALHSSLAAAQWIISGYLLALALMLPLNGWLVDRVGAKRLYLACFSAFTASSALCGLAGTMEHLIAARVLQGMAGGLLAPMTQMMVARVAGKQMARAMGIGAIPILVAPLLGPAIAGAILKYAGWPWLFYINLPVGVIAVIAAAVLLPADGPSETRRPFDMTGFLLISPGLACALYGLEETIHGRGALFLPVGAVLVAGFVWHARRAPGRALIDITLFKITEFTSAARLQFLNNGAIYAGQFLVPLYLTAGLGLSASEAGLFIIPMGIGALFAFPTTGSLVERFGARTVGTAGAVISLAGTLPMAWMSYAHHVPALLMGCMLLRGFGQGGIGIPSTASAYAALPRERLSTGTTAINIVQRLGGPVATTMVAIAMSLSTHQLAQPGPGAFTFAFVLLNVLQILILVSAQRLPGKPTTEAAVAPAA